jgi:hypothetical protein
MPLLAKTIPVMPVVKTILLREMDDEFDFTDEYLKQEVKNDDDVKRLIKRGKGLVSRDDPDTLVVGFEELKDGAEYQEHMYVKSDVGWMQDEPMLPKSLASIKADLIEKLGATPIDLPDEPDVLNFKRRRGPRWDGVLLAGDTLYLMDAKFYMSIDNVTKLVARVKRFPRISDSLALKELGVEYSKVVGVACADIIRDKTSQEANRLGLMVICPHRGMYLCDALGR